MENRNEGDDLDLILTRVRRRMALQYNAEDALGVGELRGIPGIPGVPLGWPVWSWGETIRTMTTIMFFIIV